MREDILECRLVENSIDLLTDFFNVISDGYNPVSISAKIDLTRKLDAEELFIYKTNNWIGTREYYEKRILPTKTDINLIQQRITDNFNWCLEHLTCFNEVPKLFESKFHYDNLKNLVKKVEEQTVTLIEDWVATGTEYVIDTRDGSLRRVLVIHGENKTIVLEFGNYIH